MKKAFKKSDVLKKIEEVKVKIENTSNKNEKKKLEKELEFLQDLKLFVG